MIRRGWCWWAVVYQLVRSRARFLPGLPTTAVAPQVFRSPTTSGSFSLSSFKISYFSENIHICYQWLLIMILRLTIMAMSIFDCLLDHTAPEGSIAKKGVVGYAWCKIVSSLFLYEYWALNYTGLLRCVQHSFSLLCISESSNSNYQICWQYACIHPNFQENRMNE